MMLTSFDPNQIQDLEGAQKALVLVLNLVEDVKQENDQLREIIQKLRDEISRLKGEQGKPDIKPGKKKGERDDHSSEKERWQAKKWQKGSKLDKVKVNREQILQVDKSELPADAEFKGYESVIVQELKIETNNVRFLKEKYYSPAARETWIAPLPAGYEGEFGPHVRSMVITLYYAANMSEPKVIELLSHMGIFISKGQVSNILTKKHEPWYAEKDDIYRAGLNSSRWQHIDDTGTRVDGDNQYCHILSNPLYTAYFTRPRKDRLTIIEVLQNLTQAQFLLNSQTKKWLKAFDVPKWACHLIEKWPHHEWLTYEQVEEQVESDLSRLNKQQKARVLEAAALTAYHAQTTIFSTVTGYDELDKRIAKTKAKKEQLLLVLKYPEMPLHHNPAELGARQRVRKRDVSFGPRTKDGVQAWDTFMTLSETAKKLGISFYAYIHDRISERYELPNLAEMIRQQAPAFHPVRVPAPP